MYFYSIVMKMKKSVLIFSLTLIVFIIGRSRFISAQNQSQKKLPSVQVTDIKGKTIDVSTLSNNGKPFVLCFWATWCSPCIKELNNIADLYEDWEKKTGVKIYAVSVDDSRTSAKVPAFVEGKLWPFDILLDKNQDLMRAMNFTMPPFTALINGKGEIVWTHNSYVEGDEYELQEKIEELVK